MYKATACYLAPHQFMLFFNQIFIALALLNKTFCCTSCKQWMAEASLPAANSAWQIKVWQFFSICQTHHLAIQSKG